MLNDAQLSFGQTQLAENDVISTGKSDSLLEETQSQNLLYILQVCDKQHINKIYA